MSETIASPIEQIRNSIAGLEAQRAILGEAIVAPALAALRQQLASLEAPAAPTEERRFITILFSDVVGSTSHAEQLDPEDWRQTIAQVQSTIGQIVVEHRGLIAQYQGDGLIAFFGARAVSEDDAEQAIRAGLQAQHAIARLNVQPRVQIRVGIHAGLVVLGGWGADSTIEFGAFGDTVNVAARMQSAAPPGGVLISHDTYRHVRGVFDVDAQPPLTVKGKRAPMRTYLVQRTRPHPFRTITRGVTDIETGTIGRTAELTQLQQAYHDACEHRRGVWAQLIGEAGVGKSRLLSDMDNWIELRAEAARFFRARAFAGDVNQPFTLIRRLWFDRFQIAEDEPLPQAEAKWVQGFQELTQTPDVEPAHALGLLVGLPFKDSPHIGGLRDDPAQVKGRAFVVSRTVFNTLRGEMPIVVMLEDLHWADASSLEYLMRVVVEADTANNGLFVLATARSDWRPPKELLKTSEEAARMCYLPIALAPLSDEASRELALALLQRVDFVPEVIAQLIVERSEGVPYYAEELVNLLIDRGVIDRSVEPWRLAIDKLDTTQLPQTLQHLLLTRLLGLPPGQRSCLQRGSIFGRDFWEGGLIALDIPEARTLLNPLQARGFVNAQPESALDGEREWSFHHSLLRDVTYESVLKRERKALHQAAAAWLEAQARKAGRLDEFVDRLGAHAEAAGNLDAAADWYLRAGEHAHARGGAAEARTFFDRALKIIPSDDRARRWRALIGLSDALTRLGEMDEQKERMAALLALASQLDDAHLAETYYRRGIYYDATGNYRAALRDYEAGLAAARRANDTRVEALLLAIKVICQNRLGDAEGAALTAEAALERATGTNEATTARVLNNVAVYYVESGDFSRAAELHREQAALNHRLGDRGSEANALSNLGYAYVCLGLSEEARAALEQALTINQTIGARRELVYCRLNLGLAHWRSGDAPAARQAFEQVALEVMTTGDAFARAASLSYLALALAQSGDALNAAKCFHEAGTQFDALGVRGYAIDARAGLARCTLAQGDRAEARAQIDRVWIDLKQHGAQGMEFAVWNYLTCAEVFATLDEAGRSCAAIEEGYRELIRRADKISDSKWRASFIDNVPEHRAMIATWQQLQSSNTPTKG